MVLSFTPFPLSALSFLEIIHKGSYCSVDSLSRFSLNAAVFACCFTFHNWPWLPSVQNRQDEWHFRGPPSPFIWIP